MACGNLSDVDLAKHFDVCLYSTEINVVCWFWISVQHTDMIWLSYFSLLLIYFFWAFIDSQSIM